MITLSFLPNEFPTASAPTLSASELIKKDKPDRQHCANVHAGLASDWMLLSSLTANPAPFSMAQKPPLALRVLGHVHCHRKGYLLMITLSFLPNEFPTASAPTLSASELIKKDKPDRQHCANVHAGLGSDWMLLSSLTANPAPFSMAQKPPLALRVLGHVHCHRKGYLLMITLSFLPNEFPTASAPTFAAMAKHDRISNVVFYLRKV